MKKISLLFLGIIPLLMGCSTCVESHKTIGTCGGYWQPVMIGKVMSGYFIPEHSCEITVCDRYND